MLGPRSARALLRLTASRAISSAGRAPPRQGGGHWFEPSIAHCAPRRRGAFVVPGPVSLREETHTNLSKLRICRDFVERDGAVDRRTSADVRHRAYIPRLAMRKVNGKHI